MSHILHEIENISEAFKMAGVRNEVREFMTHNTAEITYPDQAEWYCNTYIPARKIGNLFGYLLPDENGYVGYGLISRRENRWWVSGGVKEEARSQGLGKLLFKELTRITHEDLQIEEVWLDVLNTNEIAHDMYRKLGYVAVRNDGDLTIMVHKTQEAIK